MEKRFKDQLTNDGVEIFAGLVNAAVILVKASPIILIGWLLFIAPNC